jgi:ParB-like nuclease domain
MTVIATANNNAAPKIKTTKYAHTVDPLTQDQYNQFKRSIAAHGLYHPITINREGDILDGHHRMRACEELGIEPKFELKEFKDELYEELFVYDSNLARRHMSPYNRVMLAI